MSSLKLKLGDFIRILQSFVIATVIFPINNAAGFFLFIVAGFYIFVAVQRITKSPFVIKEMKIEKEDMPPEVKAFFDKIVEKGATDIGEKCKDPHCENCWGFANSEDKNKTL